MSILQQIKNKLPENISAFSDNIYEIYDLFVERGYDIVEPIMFTHIVENVTLYWNNQEHYYNNITFTSYKNGSSYEIILDFSELKYIVNYSLDVRVAFDNWNISTYQTTSKEDLISWLNTQI